MITDKEIKNIAEYMTIKRLITEVYPSGIISVVSDSFDFWGVITKILPKLRDEITNRDGRLVIRPDSGDPADIICGVAYNTYDNIDDAISGEEELMHEEASDACEGSYCMGADSYTNIAKVGDKFYNITAKFEYNRHDKQYYFVDNYMDYSERVSAFEIELEAEQKGAIECLWDVFGGTINEAGFKELDSHIGLIYGDSITPLRMLDILDRLKAKGFASTNVVFGVGSYTYQYVTRDTLNLAMKATYGVVNGEGREIFKDPATDSGNKKSHCGLLKVVRNLETDILETIQQVSWEDAKGGLLQPVFVDGKLVRKMSLQQIRDKISSE